MTLEPKLEVNTNIVVHQDFINTPSIIGNVRQHTVYNGNENNGFRPKVLITDKPVIGMVKNVPNENN